MKEINTKDKNGDKIYVGDEFWAYIVEPTFYPPTRVTVVWDDSVENMKFERNYDVEDEKGNRIWNAYMVLAHGDRVKESLSEYHKNKLKSWIGWFK